MAGVYVHLPYCTSKCGYCAFNSRPLRRADELERYVAALEAELRLRRDELSRLSVDTVYFGGGTPSLAPPSTLARILGAVVAAAASGSRPREATLEVNPEGVDEARLSALREAGFDRLSVGVQSFDGAALRFLERRHGPEEGERVVAAARRAGFANLGIDLIVGLPTPHDGALDADLERAIALAPEHLSVYLLGIESPSRLARAVARGAARAPDDDRQAEAFLACHARLGAAGYEHYEVSNYARTGFRARHNAAYWDGTPYVGLGAGAHSYLPAAPCGDMRRANVRDADRYVRVLAAGRDPADLCETITPEMALRERLMLQCRTADGLCPASYGEEGARGGAVRGAAADRLRAALDRMAAGGWFERDGDRYRPTAEGLLHADGAALALWDALDA